MPTINNYKILADLLYPTIESSGNEYYGQTKKIALENYFNDNEPFESGISTNSSHQCYFNWKLGPLSDSIKTYTSVNDNNGSYSSFPDMDKIIYINSELEQEVIKDTANNINVERSVYGTSFLKYSITIEKDSMSHSIPAGLYNTYDYNVNLHLDSLIINRNLNPINNEDISDSISEFNFIFDETTSALYVKVCSGFVVNIVSNDSSDTEENLDDSENLILKAVNGDVNIRYTFNAGELDGGVLPTVEYEYSFDGETWEILDSSIGINVESGDHILLKCTDRPTENIPYIEMSMDPENPEYVIRYGSSYNGNYWGESGYNFDDCLRYTKLIFTRVDPDSDATVEAYGNISSMVPVGWTVYGAYANLFKDCAILTRAPLIKDAYLNDLHYYHTFDGCTSLTKAPDLPNTNLATKCYEEMFYNCSSLSEISLWLTSATLSSDYSKDWLIGVSTNGIYHLQNQQPVNNDTDIDYGMPSTWINDSICSPITFTPDGDTDIIITFNNDNHYAYKKNNDSMWAACSSGVSISLNEGDKISFKRDTSYDYYSNSDSNYVAFSSTGTASIDAYGNVMSLIDELRLTDAEGRRSLLGIYESISGNATTHHYINLFKDFTCLRKAPTLYEQILSDHCYDSMFYGCTGMVNPPELNATTLAPSCYYAMFCDCTGIERAPELPATTLVTSCYAEMFSGCTSLKKAPVLVSSSLVNACYSNMFYGCSSLEQVTCLAKDISAEDCISGWLYNSGTENSSLVADIRLNWQESLPYNWHLYARNYNCNSKLDSICITGSNSEYNGRGDIYSESTLFNMESFSSVVAANELVGTYNELDGSATQEVWGYKCFNSPVTFKNGIYGTCSSMVSYYGDDLTNGYQDTFYSIFNSSLYESREIKGSELKCNIDEYPSLTSSPESGVKVYHQLAQLSSNHNYLASAASAELTASYNDSNYDKSAKVIVRSMRGNRLAGVKGYYNAVILKAGDANIRIVNSKITNPESTTNSIYTKGRIELDREDPPSGTSKDIGASDNRYRNIYAENIHGCIPYAYLDNNYNAVYPLGSLLVVKFDVDDIPFGTVLTYNNGSWKKGNGDAVTVCPSSLDGNYYENQQITDMGNGAKIVTISMNHIGKPVLVMRIK